MKSGAKTKAAGFTLIEVVVAFAILAVALAVLMSVLSDSLTRMRASEARQIAASLAESLLAQAGAERPLSATEEQGDFADGRFRWRLKTEPFGTAADQGAWPLSAYAVTATVSWGEGPGARSLSLTTLRLAPKGALR